MGKDKKADEYICVNCTWYKFDGQTRIRKTKSSTGSKLADIAQAFHPFYSYICSLPPPSIPSCNNIVYREDIAHANTPFL
jgi:hypothetical protein